MAGREPTVPAPEFRTTTIDGGDALLTWNLFDRMREWRHCLELRILELARSR
jgi:hypothetical protein